MAKNYGEEEEFNIWPTYSDVAFSIVLILLFLMFAQYVVIGKILNIAEIEKTQLLIRSKLQDRFPQEWNVSIRESSQPQLQRITFTDKILFETGSAELGVQGGNILRGVAEVITSVHDSLANHANPHQKKSLFDEIQIQGHTDNAPIGGGLQKKISNQLGIIFRPGYHGCALLQRQLPSDVKSPTPFVRARLR